MLTVYVPGSRWLTALPSAFLSVIVKPGPTTPIRDVAAGSPVAAAGSEMATAASTVIEQQSTHVTFLHLFFYALGPDPVFLRRGASGKP